MSDQAQETRIERLIKLDAASEHILHWWREPIAGFISVGIGTFDAWHYGRDAGLTISLDEALIVGGVVLIAGVKKLFSSNGDSPPKT